MHLVPDISQTHKVWTLNLTVLMYHWCTLIETRPNINSLQNQQSIKVIISGKIYFPNTFETLLEGDLLIILVARWQNINLQVLPYLNLKKHIWNLYRLRYRYLWQPSFMRSVKTHDGKQGYVRIYLWPFSVTSWLTQVSTYLVSV